MSPPLIWAKIPDAQSLASSPRHLRCGSSSDYRPAFPLKPPCCGALVCLGHFSDIEATKVRFWGQSGRVVYSRVNVGPKSSCFQWTAVLIIRSPSAAEEKETR